MDEITRLQLLLKAENEGDEEPEEDEEGDARSAEDLFSGMDDETDEDEGGAAMKGKSGKYDEAYMKRYMKKFCGSNKAYMKDLMGEIAGMKKAMEYEVDDLDFGEADATLVNGTGFFKAFSDFAAGLLKAQQAIVDRLDAIEGNAEYATELTKAAGEVLIKATEGLTVAGSAPAPVRSTFSASNLFDLKKAGSGRNVRKVKDLLMKAATGGDSRAITALTVYEISGGNLELVDAPTRSYIENLEGGE